jgi:uncharacterized glyoxalase superfamily protein PhnB
MARNPTFATGTLRINHQLAQNVRSPAEVDATLAQAVAGAGGKLLKRARAAFWGGYSGYFADPDGHPWEIAHNPQREITD